VKKLFLTLGFLSLVLACSKDEKSKVLATVNGKNITLNDLEAKHDDLAKQLFDLKNKEYSFIEYFLNQEIEEILIDLEANKRGLTKEKLLAQEVEAKTKMVTDEEVANFAKERGIPDDQVAQLNDRIKAFLARSGSMEAKTKFADTLKEKYSVKINIEKPNKPADAAKKVAFKLADNDIVVGNLNSKVTVVKFFSFSCGYCKRAADTFKTLKNNYADKVKFVYKVFPLGPSDAEQAFLCANEQGKALEYYDILFQNTGAYQTENLIKYANELKLDTNNFKSCVESGRMKTIVEASLSQGQSYGISGVPAFIVNNELIVGAVPYEDLKAPIDAALGR